MIQCERGFLNFMEDTSLPITPRLFLRKNIRGLAEPPPQSPQKPSSRSSSRHRKSSRSKSPSQAEGHQVIRRDADAQQSQALAESCGAPSTAPSLATDAREKSRVGMSEENDLLCRGEQAAIQTLQPLDAASVLMNAQIEERLSKLEQFIDDKFAASATEMVRTAVRLCEDIELRCSHMVKAVRGELKEMREAVGDEVGRCSHTVEAMRKEVQEIREASSSASMPCLAGSAALPLDLPEVRPLASRAASCTELLAGVQSRAPPAREEVRDVLPPREELGVQSVGMSDTAMHRDAELATADRGPRRAEPGLLRRGPNEFPSEIADVESGSSSSPQLSFTSALDVHSMVQEIATDLQRLRQERNRAFIEKVAKFEGVQNDRRSLENKPETNKLFKALSDDTME